MSSDRYDAEGVEAGFQPGSNGEVLANRLGIIDPTDMAEAELVLLDKLYQSVLVDALPYRALTVEDLRGWHRRWLGNVYAWAGQDRSVNLSKGGFHFAIAAQIAKLLEVFERECLARFTPCAAGLSDEELAVAIAQTHVEFILIHPFREGNGRLSRLLADVMAVQAGRGPLDYSGWDTDKPRYFGAIQQGMAGNNSPMQQLTAVAMRGSA